MLYDNFDRPLIHLFMHIGKLLNDTMRNSLSQKNIHFGQARILMALSKKGTLSQGEIGHGLHIKPATVTNQVKKMEVTGLIRREQDIDDDRVMNVTLTVKGRDAADFAAGMMRQAEKIIRSDIAENDIDTLRNYLLDIRNSLGGTDPTIR